MRFITAIASAFALAEAQQCATGNCPQVVQQPVQVVQQTMNTVTCGQGNNCCKPPMPELVGQPKVEIRPGNAYTIRKIVAKRAPEVSFQKHTVERETLEVPCMMEHESYKHNDQPCAVCDQSQDHIETVKKVSWNVELIREKVAVFVPVPKVHTLTFENEQARVTAEYLLVRKPRITSEQEVRVQKCRNNIAAEEVVNRGNCDQDAVIQVPVQQPQPQPTPCATGGCPQQPVVVQPPQQPTQR